MTGGVNFASIVAKSAATSDAPVKEGSDASTAPSAKKSFSTTKTPASAPSSDSNKSSNGSNGGSDNAGNNGGETPRRPSPLNAAYDRKVNEFEAKIKTLKQRMEDLRSDAYGANDGSSEVRAQRTRLRSQLRELNAKLTTVDEDKKRLQDEMDLLKTMHAKRLEQLQAQRDKLPVKTVEECDRRIGELERLIEQGSLPLRDEKGKLQEISKLRKNRKALEGLVTDNAVESVDPNVALKAKVDILKSRLDGKWAESKQLRKDLSAAKEQLRALDGDKEQALKREQEREAQVAALKLQLDAVYAEKRAAYEDFKRQKAERAAAYERNQQRREELRKRQEVEDQLDVLYKRLRSIDPRTHADRQLNECVNVGNYFGDLLTPMTTHAATAHVPTTEPPAAGARKPDTPNADEWAPVTLKAHRGDVYYQAPLAAAATRKSSAAANGSSASSSLLTQKHPIQILGALSDLGLTVPHSVEDAKQLLVDVGRRRETIEEARDRALESVKARQDEVQRDIDVLKAKLADLVVAPDSASKRGRRPSSSQDATEDGDGKAEPEAEAEVEAEH
jgi:uncharacterized coiled-coil DUF342 family protein